MNRFVKFSEPVAVIKKRRACYCGCTKDIVDGLEYDGDFFNTPECLAKMMIAEGWVKRFE